MTPAIDDDAHWLSIDEALERRIKQVRYGDIAVRELQDALEQDRLPCMVWSTVTGKRTRLKHTVWTERLILWLGKDGLLVMLRRQPGDAPNVVRQYRDGRLYVSLPDFETIWPAKLTDDSSEVPTSRPPVRISHRKVGHPPALTPQEIKRGKAMILRADREHRRKYPKQGLKIGAALDLLQSKLKRKGKPIPVGRTTLKTHIVWPVLRPAKTDNN